MADYANAKPSCALTCDHANAHDHTGSVEKNMLQTSIWPRSIAIAGLALALFVGVAAAQQPLKIGLIQSMTGAFNTVGKAAVNGARLYIQQHGDTVAGRKIQLIVKDDATSPEAAKRLAQELIVNDKVAIIGAGITPSALTIAPLVT